MDSNGSLSDIQIDNPSLWRLAMRLGPDRLDVVMYSPMHEGSLVYRRVPFDKAAPSKLRALETCVYDNKLLLSEFSRISCVVESPVAMVLPPGLDDVSDDDAALARDTLMHAAYPDFDGDTFLCPSGMPGVAIMAGLDGELLPFLRRTFFNVSLSHHLSPLCRYFLSAAGRAGCGRLYANLRPGAVDIVAALRGRLLMANTMTVSAPADAAYYVLAVLRHLQMTDNAETLLAGDASLRDEVAPLLKQFNIPVMPVIFPSEMFRAGKDAMRAPFDLIILPLCE